VRCDLTWVISIGARTSSGYEASKKQTYTIDLDAAVMAVAGERRAFEVREAEEVHSLIDLISTYTIESTIWWDVGRGERLGRAGNQEGMRDRADPTAAHMAAPHHWWPAAQQRKRRNGNSIYHSMQLSLNKRFAQGFSLLASYTWLR
jgi:hypothetical protein